MSDLEYMWSSTDFPFMCLVDSKRTLFLQDAIIKTIKSGDIVLDIGSGTGILALIAAKAGAKKVYAIEFDNVLAKTLKQTIKENGFNNVIEVLNVDALKVAPFECKIDVVISELIDTGLIDELQVPVYNHLVKTKVVDNETVFLPDRYTTYVCPINTNLEYFGFKIMAPKHNWPFYKENMTEWQIGPNYFIGEKKICSDVKFDGKLIQESQNYSNTWIFPDKTLINSIGIYGRMYFPGMSTGGEFNSLNGEKIIPFEHFVESNTLTLDLNYNFGKGLNSLHIKTTGETK